jgi:deoxyhypusine monooxygenase
MVGARGSNAAPPRRHRAAAAAAPLLTAAPPLTAAAHRHAGLKDASALLRHEVAYCLGQRQDPAAVAALAALLADASEHPMVRHEAGEALGAIATPACLAPLRAHAADASLEVAQTCQLALQRVEFFAARGSDAGAADAAGPYRSVDPTPPAPAATPTSALRATLLDARARVFDRYRAMFALRDRGGAEAVAALAAAFGASDSALLKHEVAYVLGQMQDAGANAALAAVLADGRENAMVRHEAAEALGAIASDECLALLRAHVADPEPIVADSCVVALDVLEHERSGAAEYCDAGV